MVFIKKKDKTKYNKQWGMKTIQLRTVFLEASFISKI